MHSYILARGDDRVLIPSLTHSVALPLAVVLLVGFAANYCAVRLTIGLARDHISYSASIVMMWRWSPVRQRDASEARPRRRAVFDQLLALGLGPLQIQF